MEYALFQLALSSSFLFFSFLFLTGSWISLFRRLHPAYILSGTAYKSRTIDYRFPALNHLDTWTIELVSRENPLWSNLIISYISAVLFLPSFYCCGSAVVVHRRFSATPTTTTTTITASLPLLLYFFISSLRLFSLYPRIFPLFLSICCLSLALSISPSFALFSTALPDAAGLILYRVQYEYRALLRFPTPVLRCGSSFLRSIILTTV